MDVAAAYLFAGQEDINGTAPQALPGGAAQRYFTDGQGYSPGGRRKRRMSPPASRRWTARSHDCICMMSGVVPSLFAVLQAVIFSCARARRGDYSALAERGGGVASFNATEAICWPCCAAISGCWSRRL